jgi:hypothetical protein
MIEQINVLPFFQLIDNYFFLLGKTYYFIVEVFTRRKAYTLNIIWLDIDDSCVLLCGGGVIVSFTPPPSDPFITFLNYESHAE